MADLSSNTNLFKGIGCNPNSYGAPPYCDGSYNVGFGYYAFRELGIVAKNPSPNRNAAYGSYAGRYTSSGDFNTFIGSGSGSYAVYGGQNTYLGGLAGSSSSNAGSNTTGANNTAIGFSCGVNIQDGSSNLLLGSNTGSSVVNGTNNIMIGVGVNSTSDVSNALIIGNANNWVTNTATSYPALVSIGATTSGNISYNAAFTVSPAGDLSVNSLTTAGSITTTTGVFTGYQTLSNKNYSSVFSPITTYLAFDSSGAYTYAQTYYTYGGAFVNLVNGTGYTSLNSSGLLTVSGGITTGESSAVYSGYLGISNYTNHLDWYPAVYYTFYLDASGTFTTAYAGFSNTTYTININNDASLTFTSAGNLTIPSGLYSSTLYTSGAGGITISASSGSSPQMYYIAYDSSGAYTYAHTYYSYGGDFVNQVNGNGYTSLNSSGLLTVSGNITTGESSAVYSGFLSLSNYTNHLDWYPAVYYTFYLDASGTFTTAYAGFSNTTYTININNNTSLTLTSAGNLTIPGTGIGIAWNTYSDKNLKKNIVNSSYGLSKILEMNSVTYHFNTEDDNKKKRIGFLAQDMESILPEIVNTFIDDDGNNRLTLDYLSIIPVLVNAIKELKGEIDALKAAL